jgi:hypothetical protein
VTIFDLLFVLTVLVTLCMLGRAVYLLVRSRMRPAGHLLVRLCALLGAYAVVLVLVSLISPQQVLGLRQPRCFDDWCLQVDQVTWRPAVGRAPLIAMAHEGYAVVTIRVLSRARRAIQRAPDARIYLLAGGGQRYATDTAAQRALEAQGAGGLPLDSAMAPGGSFVRTVAFDVPATPGPVDLLVEHGLFPDILVIGDAQSFLHKPTVIALPGSR